MKMTKKIILRKRKIESEYLGIGICLTIGDEIQQKLSNKGNTQEITVVRHYFYGAMPNEIRG